MTKTSEYLFHRYINIDIKTMKAKFYEYYFETQYEIWQFRAVTLLGESYAGLILGLCPANERRWYKVTPFLIGWAGRKRKISPAITNSSQPARPTSFTQNTTSSDNTVPGLILGLRPANERRLFHLFPCIFFRAFPFLSYSPYPRITCRAGIKPILAILFARMVAKVSDDNSSWPLHKTPGIRQPFNSLRPSDAYMRQWTNHHWFR